MLFNSFAFLIFFPLVCILYFLLPHKFRWLLLLVSSYYFYMNWKPIYAILMFSSTLTTYLCGIFIEKYGSKKNIKRLLLISSLIINLGILFLFKYFNFINNTIFHFMDQIGIKWDIPNLDLLLPVGISFYTFQAIGYSIDVYRGDINAEKHFGIYALFVSFFPQLVAGPIERAKNLLPQFREFHSFHSGNVTSGLKQMLWGFFMKVVVADRVSLYVDSVYNNVDQHNGTTLILATLLFAVQIYCDFAGYSNIAIGSAKVMGFRLMDNFHRPYFSVSISEFWKRWHISLSTWFKDYVYIPLGGNRVNPSRHLVNLFLTFFISGIWHGANWTFICWGALHGFYLVTEVLIKKYLNISNNVKIPIKGMGIIITFLLTVFAWVFFRANSLNDAFLIIKKIFSELTLPYVGEKAIVIYMSTGFLILLFKEIRDEFFPYKFAFFENRNILIRYMSYMTIIILILLIGVFDGGQFIYFQF